MARAYYGVVRRVVLIADDASSVRGLRLALRHAAGIRVVATVNGGGSVRAPLARHAPDLVVVDELCQRSNSFTCLREAHEALPGAQIVLLARSVDAKLLEQGFDAGADAVISRERPPAVLGMLLAEVVQASVFHTPRRLLREAPEREAPRAAPPLQSVPTAGTIA